MGTLKLTLNTQEWLKLLGVGFVVLFGSAGGTFSYNKLYPIRDDPYRGSQAVALETRIVETIHREVQSVSAQLNLIRDNTLRIEEELKIHLPNHPPKRWEKAIDTNTEFRIRTEARDKIR